jgi:small-conductance mechanosensitive channel
MFDNQYLNAVLIVFAFWLGSYFITIFIGFLGMAAKKTKTTLDEKIIKAIKLPIRYLSIIIGFYYAVGYLSFDFSFKGINAEKILYVLLVLVISYTISRLVKTFFIWYSEKDVDAKNASKTMFVFLRKITSVSVYAFALVFILGHFGVEIRPLLAGLGIAGLAIALGLQETLANLFAALFIVMDKSINVGDWIKLEDDTKAYIEDISWRSVRIREIGGNMVIVPNSLFVNQRISSYDYPESPFSTWIDIGVAYDSDLDKVEKTAIRAANNVIKNEEISIEENEPIVRFTALAESSINFILIIKVDEVQNEGRIKHALIKEVIKEFKKENIEIPFPHVRVVK